MDVLICNWLGTYLGMKTCEYFEMKVSLRWIFKFMSSCTNVQYIVPFVLRPLNIIRAALLVARIP